jgi:hypothetical protein
VTSEQAIRQWLREVWDRDFSEGGKLVELLPGADNAARAAKLLRQMEEEGWIVRSRTPQPTPSQRAFLGLTYPRGIPPEHAEAYGWMPNRDSPGLREALGLTEAMRGLPYAELQRIWREEHRAREAAAAAREPAPRPVKKGARTYAEAQRDFLSYLRQQGWAVSPPLKEPHATSPDGGYRIWFRPQAVYYAPREAGKYDRSRAHSLWFRRDLRQMDGPEFVSEVEESHELRRRT